jgi:hypothetical protein
LPFILVEASFFLSTPFNVPALFLPALLFQTNPNWIAFYIITDPSPFDSRLQEILASFNDERLVYVNVSMDHRPVVSGVKVHILFMLFD